MTRDSEQEILAGIRTILAFERNLLSEERTALSEFRTGLTISIAAAPVSALATYLFSLVYDEGILLDLLSYTILILIAILGIYMALLSRTSLTKIQKMKNEIKNKKFELIEKSVYKFEFSQFFLNED